MELRMSDSIDASIVVPTLNEADNVGRLIEELASNIKGINYEVIIVDDGSTDGTVKVAEETARRLGVNLKVIERGRRLGLSSAVIDGIRASRGGIIVVMDADLQHPPSVVPKLIEAVSNGADVAVASRYIKGGGIAGNWPLLRRIISRGAVTLAHILVPTARDVKDPVSGFFAVKRSAVCLGKPHGDYKILLDILALCRVRRIAEVPYVFRTREAGSSKLGTKQIINYVKQIASISLSLLSLSGYRPIKFAIVGVIGLFVSELVLHVFWRMLGLAYFISLIPAIEAGVVNNFTLNKVWTFKDRSVGYWVGLGKYHVASLTGTAVTYAVTNLLHYVLGVNGYVAYIIGVIFGFIANYIMAEIYVFKYHHAGTSS
ncbi:glycosyltransferase family 2 protein [Caldivirga sp.]|uniref:glycosyltransferase family 2 protein n=1 Tax=Caldivirga sp. TaxID=2080243 RepID=UPI0025C1F42D|nr:glycosyltransferase family 2 protein [Caldivirga sp.]